MVIRAFVWILLILALISYFVPVETNDKKDIDNDIALLTFTDSIMYTLTPQSTNRIVYSKKVMRFKNRDEMYDGALTLKGLDNDGKEITDTLLSDKIIKVGDDFTFINNVKFRRNDYITLNTNELMYNAKTKIAINTLPFDGSYFNNYIKGKNIYLDLNKYYMRSKDTHFEIDVKEGK